MQTVQALRVAALLRQPRPPFNRRICGDAMTERYLATREKNSAKLGRGSRLKHSVVIWSSRGQQADHSARWGVSDAARAGDAAQRLFSERSDWRQVGSPGTGPVSGRNPDAGCNNRHDNVFYHLKRRPDNIVQSIGHARSTGAGVLASATGGGGPGHVRRQADCVPRSTLILAQLCAVASCTNLPSTVTEVRKAGPGAPEVPSPLG